MALATIEAVEIELGRPITDQAKRQQVESWIRRVEAIVIGRCPDIEQRIADGDLDAALVASVIAGAVVRKIRNPDGKVQEGVDDYSYRLNENTRKGELFLTDEEWGLICPSVVSGAFTVRPHFEPDGGRRWVGPDVWEPHQ